MEPVKVFYCYAREDDALRQELATHLAPLRRQGIIEDWCDRMISPGQPWEEAINQRLESAQLILLLVSAYFLASDYCYQKEMKRALERHEAGEVQVIPVILRPVDWELAPFSKLQCLPSDARAVTLWSDIHAAFTDIAKGIRRAAEVEAQRRAQEAEARRKAEEAEARRKAEEAEARRQAEEVEVQRRAAEAEARRKAEEDEARKAEEAEVQRRTQEEEAQRRAAEEDAYRKTKKAKPSRPPSSKFKRTIIGTFLAVFLAVGGYLLIERDRKPPPILVQPSNKEQSPQTPPPSSTPPTSITPAIQNIHGWSADKVQALQQQTAKALETSVVFQDKLKAGGQGPEMVVIPGGRFLMGSPSDETQRENDERQHEVEVKRFAIGKYEVTVEEFKCFVEAAGYRTEAETGDGCYSWDGSQWKKDPNKNWRQPGFEQDGVHPVVCVSWNDAMAYVEWLSGQTGQRYRLLTEAEWEYAVRAGTITPFYFGLTISTDQANYNGNGCN
jgi:formylglycine-generating enzyme required for sulfatase activity